MRQPKQESVAHTQKVKTAKLNLSGLRCLADKAAIINILKELKETIPKLFIENVMTMTQIESQQIKRNFPRKAQVIKVIKLSKLT